MADIDIVDMTGQPRSLHEYKEALIVVNQAMINPLFSRPLLVVNFGTIRDGLQLIVAAMEKHIKEGGE